MSDETKDSGTITIKKDSLWKYSTLVLLLVVVVGAFFIFRGGGSPSGNVVDTGSNTQPGIVDYSKYAGDIGLDVDEFNSCLENEEFLDKVKTDFQTGSTQGIQGTPGFFINSQQINGAYPFTSFQQAIEQELSNPTQAYELNEGDHVEGDLDAPVTIIEYSDFKCPYCARFYSQTLDQIESSYVDTGKVKFVYRHFNPTFVNPSYHPGAIEASLAAECAGAQGKFWEMHDMLFEQGA